MKRVFVTGPSGSGRRPCAESLRDHAQTEGKSVQIIDLWEEVLASSSVDPVTFLNLPIEARNPPLEKAFNSARGKLRKAEKDGADIALVLAHAVFRWQGTLVDAFPEELLDEIHPDVFVTVIHNIFDMHDELQGTPFQELALHELVSWRDDEARKTEEWANSSRRAGEPAPFFLIARNEPPVTLYGCLFEPSRTRIYASYPMSHVPQNHIEKTQRMIEMLRKSFVVFNPNSINDLGQLRERQEELASTEKTQLGESFGKQIVKRDYLLIDQSDWVVVFYPSVPYEKASSGEPKIGENIPLSAGVIAEMVHGHRKGRRVYAVWYPSEQPSPFFSYHCSTVARPQDGANEEDIVSRIVTKIAEGSY